MSGEQIGLIGGIIGVLGGLFGTYCSIKNTNGPKERALMIKLSIYTWVGISVFIGLLCVLPAPYKYFLWVVYGLALTYCIPKWNKLQMQVRQQESGA